MEDMRMKHAPVIQKEIDQNKRADEAWQAYQKELGRHGTQVHLLHRNTIGMYTCDGDRVADFLTLQREKLIGVREANDEFIKLMMETKKEEIAKRLSNV